MTDSLPLSGAVVLDLGDEPMISAGRYLADLGARVVRIESANGDRIRRVGPWVDGEPGNERALRHLLYNQGKESLALDLDAAESWDIIEQIASQSDVVIAPLAKSPMAARFIQDLHESAQRDDGPSVIDVIFRRNNPSEQVTDLIAMAAGSQLVCNGFPDIAPDYPAGKLGYKQSSNLAVAAAVASIFQRARGGPSVSSTISLQEAVISTIIQAANPNLYNWHGMVAERTGTGGLRYPIVGRGPGSFESGEFESGEIVFIDTPGVTFETADGLWVTYLQSPTNLTWQAFPEWYAEVTGDDQLIGEPWSEPSHRITHQVEMQEFVRKFCKAQQRDALIERAQRNTDLALPVQTGLDIAADEHLHERGFFPEVEHPVLNRTLALPRTPYRSTGLETTPRPAPGLGEHSADVLRELGGYPGKQITELIDLGVVNGERPTSQAPADPFERSPIAIEPRPATRLPLEGVRVLDFCWMAAGPLITEMLANLGADVIKIESVSGIDTVREFSHPPEGFTIDTGAFFNDTNTDKRSMTLNLHHPKTRELIIEMLPHFDLVTNNFAPGAMEKFHLTYDELREHKPDLIYASFPVMGTFGPKKSYRGIGNGVTALSGVAGHTGQPDRAPIGIGTLHTDFTLAPLASSLLISALIHRERTGEGQQIEIAQYEAAVHLLDHELMDALINGVDTPRIGNRSTEYCPHGLFPASGEDSWLAVAVRDRREWRELCDLLGRDDLAQRDDLITLEGRKAAEDEIEAALSAWSARHEVWEASSMLQARGIPASPAETAADLAVHDTGAESLFFRYDRGDVPFITQHQPFTWNGERLGSRPSPGLGEHSEEILKGEFGVDDERYVELLIEQVIF